MAGISASGLQRMIDGIFTFLLKVEAGEFVLPALAVAALATAAFAAAVLDVHGAMWSGRTVDRVACDLSICSILLRSCRIVRFFR